MRKKFWVDAELGNTLLQSKECWDDWKFLLEIGKRVPRKDRSVCSQNQENLGKHNVVTNRPIYIYMAQISVHP